MKRIGPIFMLGLFVCCSANTTYSPAFKEFDFSYNDTWTSSFSMKFTRSDTVYVRQHFWYSHHISSDSDVKEGTTSVGILNTRQRFLLDSFLTNIHFKQYATRYIDDRLSDGISYDFYLQTESIKRTIRLYGDSVPPPLFRFGCWIAEMKEGLSLKPVDTSIVFRSYRPLPPPPEVDLRKFVPPTKAK